MNKHLKNNKTRGMNLKRWMECRSLANESGVALIVALMLMLVIVTMVPAAMQLTSGEFDRSKNFQEQREAFFVADAGMEHIKVIYQNSGSNTALWGTDGSLTATTDNGTFTDVAGTPIIEIVGSTAVNGVTSEIDNATHNYTQVTFNGGSYRIRIWDNDDEAVLTGGLTPLCNPSPCTSADPLWDSSNEDWVDRDGTIYAESIGTSANGTTKTIFAILKRKNLPANNVPAAMTLVGPQATYRSNSNAGWTQGADGVGGDGFGIDGLADADCNGKEGLVIEAENNPGVGDWTNLTNPNASTADLAACIAGASNVCLGWSPSNSQTDVTGTASDIITGSTDFTALDAEKLFDDFVVDNTPDQVLTVPSTDADVTNWGTPSNPVVIHVTSDLSMTGNTGYGVLVVDGNLDLGGNVEWNGIVIISGCDTCEGSLTGSGGFTVNGSVIIGNDGLDGFGNPTVSLSDYGGTPRYRYSCEGIEIANGAYGDSFLTASWNEIVVN